MDNKGVFVSSEVIGDVLQELREYTDQHFELEEKYTAKSIRSGIGNSEKELLGFVLMFRITNTKLPRKFFGICLAGGRIISPRRISNTRKLLLPMA